MCILSLNINTGNIYGQFKLKHGPGRQQYDTCLTEESVQLQPPKKPTRLKAMTGTECNRNYLHQSNCCTDEQITGLSFLLNTPFLGHISHYLV